MLCIDCISLQAKRPTAALLIVNQKLYCVKHAPHIEPVEPPPVVIDYKTTPHKYVGSGFLGLVCALCGQGGLAAVHLQAL